MNALIEMTQLARTMPTAGATAAEVGAWYEAKGRLHDHLSQTAASADEAARERAHATGAFQRARTLLGGAP